MLVKILNADPDFVSGLKQVTGQAVASRAYEFAARHHLRLMDRVECLETEVSRLQAQLDASNQPGDWAALVAAIAGDSASASSL